MKRIVPYLSIGLLLFGALVLLAPILLLYADAIGYAWGAAPDFGPWGPLRVAVVVLLAIPGTACLAHGVTMLADLLEARRPRIEVPR